jgi:exopolyphosphatase/guanosine-5'-triphosphate,3'-diphosphate pyrophosphatase
MQKKMSQHNTKYTNSHYAVIDLGSNSFHLLITQLVDNKIEIVDKVKQKVRLASGLNSRNELSNEAIIRGLGCLTLFSKHLINIPLSNIRIVTTATLRIAVNRDDFLTPANKILPLKINLLSGELEARTIYSGVAHTSQGGCHKKRLVIDIGGASTELIIGQGFEAKHAISLNLGCVSYKEKFFSNGLLTEENFSTAIYAASNIITPVAEDFLKLGWQSVLGSSGCMQALAEILRDRQQPIIINLTFMQEIKQELIHCKNIGDIQLSGLRDDRKPVLASGLSILIALFNVLEINELTLSTGALREGLLYEMIPSQSVF